MRRTALALTLCLALAALAGCSGPQPVFTDQPLSARPSSSASTPTTSSSLVAPSRPAPDTGRPAPTDSLPSSTTASTSNAGTTDDGFLSLRFDCQYVPDSFEDQWAMAGAEREGFGEPRPGQRYSFGHIGGRALGLFTTAFETGI